MKTKISDSQKKDSTDLASEVIGVLPVNNGGTGQIATAMVNKKRGLMKVNFVETGYSFANGLMESPQFLNINAGYNNNVALNNSTNDFFVVPTGTSPNIVTGIDATGRLQGEIIILRTTPGGMTWFLAMDHLKETSLPANRIMTAGSSALNSCINYIPVTDGQAAILFYNTNNSRWVLLNALELRGNIPMKKGISYTQQAAGAVNIANIIQNNVGAGSVVQSSSTPSVGAYQSLSVLNTGTTGTGRSSILTGGSGLNLVQYALGNNLIEAHFEIVVPVASSATQRFNVRAGLMNNTTAPTVGIWASYRDDENGGNWTFKCNNGGTVTVVNTALAVNAGVVLTFSIIWNGIEAKLVQAGVVRATIPVGTTNFPTTQGCTPMLTIEKLVGTTPSILYFAMCGLMRLETTM